ncbi:MAG TPA: hypothetical protein VF100_12750, partial [Thermoanaerobaculia bacterium]
MSHLYGDGTATAPGGLARWRSHAIALATALVVFTVAFVALAHVMDVFGAPPAGDPSAHTGPLIGEQEAIDDLALLDPANEGGLEGGDPFANNFFNENQVDSNREFDVPTGAPLSPLFGAGEFEQQRLRFEEFGAERLATAGPLAQPFPQPST